MSEELINLIASETGLEIYHDEFNHRCYGWRFGKISCELSDFYWGGGFASANECLVDALKVLLGKIPDVDFDEDEIEGEGNDEDEDWAGEWEAGQEPKLYGVIVAPK